MRYAVIIERGENSYGAYVPDLPGCIAVGDTLEEVRILIQEAIKFHFGRFAKRWGIYPTA